MNFSGSRSYRRLRSSRCFLHVRNAARYAPLCFLLASAGEGKREQDLRQNIPFDDLQDHGSRVNRLEITTSRLEHQTHFALTGHDDFCASFHSSLFPLHLAAATSAAAPAARAIISIGKSFQCYQRRKVRKVSGSGVDEERRRERERGDWLLGEGEGGGVGRKWGESGHVELGCW